MNQLYKQINIILLWIATGSNVWNIYHLLIHHTLVANMPKEESVKFEGTEGTEKKLQDQS